MVIPSSSNYRASGLCELGSVAAALKMLAEQVCATCCLLHMFGALYIMQAWPAVILEVGLWHSCHCIRKQVLSGTAAGTFQGSALHTAVVVSVQ